jgi:molecular chaperone DnaK
VAAINSAIEDLARAQQEIGKRLYEQASAQAGAGPGGETAGPGPGAPEGGAESGGEEKKDDDVIDAEFEVKE